MNDDVDDTFDLDGTEVRVRDGNVECRSGGDPWQPADLQKWASGLYPPNGSPEDKKARALWDWLDRHGVKPPQ